MPQLLGCALTMYLSHLTVTCVCVKSMPHVCVVYVLDDDRCHSSSSLFPLCVVMQVLGAHLWWGWTKAANKAELGLTKEPRLTTAASPQHHHHCTSTTPSPHHHRGTSTHPPPSFSPPPMLAAPYVLSHAERNAPGVVMVR